MSKVHPTTLLAFFALGIGTYVAYAHFTSDTVSVAVGRCRRTPAQTVAAVAPPAVPVAPPVETAETVAAAAPIVTVEPLAPAVAATPAATPNHEPRHVGPAPSVTIIPIALRAEPQLPAPTEPAAPSFVTVDATRYARDNARLRAAPSTSADVLTKLAAGAPLHLIARSTDGAWWQVSLAGGRIGYVNQAAVSKSRPAKPKPPAAAPAPVATLAPAQPAPARPKEGMLGYVDEAMNWFSQTAAQGRAPAAKPTER